MNIHNKSYKYISKVAIKIDNGTHPKHRLMNYHQFFLDNIKSSDVVLDIGCGKGIVADSISKKAKQVVAIDIVPEHITYARKKYPHKNVTYIVGDVISYKFKTSFNKILLSNVLEHIEDRVELLKKCTKLAPVILLRVPLITRSWMPLYQKELGVDYRLDPTHTTEYTIDQVKSEAKAAGWQVASFEVQFGECWAVLKRKS